MFRHVKASAGAGKTHTLTLTFLERLASALDEDPQAACGRSERGYCWPEILAVTFTNKAAAEMRERVLTSLKKRALGQDDTGPAQDWPRDRARDWLTTLIRRLGSLNIRTIDSLLHMLLRLSALELGLPPDFEPVFGEGEFYDTLFDAAFNQGAETDPAIRESLLRAYRAVLHYGGVTGFHLSSRFHARLLGVLSFRLNHDVPLSQDRESLWSALSALHEEMRATADILLREAEVHSITLNKHFATFLAKCAASSVHEKTPTSTYIQKPGLADCVLAASLERITPEAETAFADLALAHAAYLRKSPLLRDALELMPFVSLSGRLFSELDGYQAKHGIVPSSRWPAYAAQLLEGEFGPGEAFCRLGARLHHLLIDEFQDTSRAQWNVLAPLAVEALSKGGSLFYVGDVKQSIYGWRGGDPNLFADVPMDSEILALAGSCPSENLDTNWRSAHQVVEFNNGFFSRLADKDFSLAVSRAMLHKAPESMRDRLAEHLAAVYADTRQQVCEKNQGKNGYVRLATLFEDDQALLNESIRENLDTLLNKELLTRRPYGDIAILVRTGEQAALVSQWLIDWSLPVVTENSLRLGEHPLIRQAVAFLSFLDYPLNNLAFWEFISGTDFFLPMSGLGRSVLHDWLLRNRGKSLFHAFRRDFPDEFSRLVEPFHRRAGLMRPYDLVSELFHHYQTLNTHPKDELFIRRFLETVHMAEERGAASLSAFLELWKQKGGEEKVPLPDHLDAIRILTIHKAKGLEYPVVIAPFHHLEDRTAGELAAWNSGEPRDATYLATLRRELGETYYDTVIPMLTEQINLVYVTWTRAAEELYAFITGTPRSKGRSSLLRGLAAMLAPYKINENKSIYEHGMIPDTFNPAPKPESMPEPVPSVPDREAARPMDWLPRLKIFRNAFEPKYHAERQRGILVHRFFEILAATPLSPSLDQAVESALRRTLPHPGDAPLGTELKAMAHWLLYQDEFPEFLARGVPEQSVLGEDGSLHRVDLLADLKDRTLAIEYKTGAPHPDHRKQLQHYLGLLNKLSGRPADKPVQGFLVYLDRKHMETIPGDAA